MTDWTIVTRSLRVRLFSTATTALTVAVAVALLLVLLMMRSAGRQAFERGSGNVHLLISRDASTLTSVLNGLFYVGAPAKPIEFAEFEAITASAPLEWALPVQLGDSYRGTWPVLATSPEFFTRFRPAMDTAWTFARGEAFKANFEVVAGAAASRGAGLKVGDKIVLTHGTGASRGEAAHVHDEFAYTVVGVLNATGTMHDRALFTNLESAWIIHAADRIEKAAHAEEDHDHDHHAAVTAADLIESDRKLTNIYVRAATRPGSDVSAAVPVIAERLRRDPRFAAAPLTIAGPKAEIDRLFVIVGNIDGILLAMAFAVLVSSGIAIMLALYNSMEQRRRQIAVLRVLGASAGRIFALVLTESAVIGLLGVVGGVALGVVGGWVAAAAMKARVGLVIDPNLEPRLALVVCAGALVLACVAGLVPALMAYRTGVATNLRPAA